MLSGIKWEKNKSIIKFKSWVIETMMTRKIVGEWHPHIYNIIKLSVGNF